MNELGRDHDAVVKRWKQAQEILSEPEQPDLALDSDDVTSSESDSDSDGNLLVDFTSGKLHLTSLTCKPRKKLLLGCVYSLHFLCRGRIKLFRTE